MSLIPEAFNLMYQSEYKHLSSSPTFPKDFCIALHLDLAEDPGLMMSSPSGFISICKVGTQLMFMVTLYHQAIVHWLHVWQIKFLFFTTCISIEYRCYIHINYFQTKKYKKWSEWPRYIKLDVCYTQYL